MDLLSFPMWSGAFRLSGQRGIVEAIIPIQSKLDLFRNMCSEDEYLLISFLCVDDIVQGKYDGCQVA